MPSPIVTILFTDLEGSTALQSLRGDEAATAVTQTCEEVSRARVSEYEGRVVKSLGDGLMVAFASPRNAVLCALAIHEDLAALAETSPRLAARMRAGIHAGEVLDSGDDLHGATVSAAARICAQADGGQVLVSDVVRQLSGTVPGTMFRDSGRFALKGFEEPWHLYEVVKEADAGGREAIPFVGRRAERAELRELLERALGGRGAFVLIGGEAGVGKTRLADQAAMEARRRGFGVLTGHCYEGHADLPYGPWVEMIGTGARQVGPEQISRLLGENAPALAQLAPEIRQLLPDIPPMVELPASQRRWYLFNAVRDFLANTAQWRPLVLFFDDLHWADDSTLLLCEALAGWVEELPVVVLGTYRDTPTDHSPRLADTLAVLARRRTARLIKLPPHDKDDVREMIRAMSGDAPPSPVTDAIYGETEGNAFFVMEVFRHFAESGRLFDERGRFRPDLDIAELEVPTNARLVIEHRLRRLGEGTRRLLSMAAVLGRRFAVEELALMAETKDDDLLDDLEEAERASIVSEDREGGDNYEFNHELFRQTLLSGLSGLRRRRHHLRAADAIEQVHAGDLKRHAAEITGHLVQGGAPDPVRTAHYLRLAGERAQEAAAHEEALRYFTDALAMLPPDHDRQRADLLLALGLAQRSLSQWNEAIESWDQALTLLEALGEAEACGALCWDFTRQLTWAYRFQEMAQVAERGLAVLGDRPSRQRARLLVMRGLALALGRQPEAAVAHVEEAKQLAEHHGDSSLLGDVLAMASVLHYFFMQLPQNTEVAGRAAEKLREVGGLWTLADTLAFLDVALAFQGRFSESQEIEAELEPLVERLGHWGAAAAARRNKFAVTAASQADLLLLEVLAREQLKAAQATDNPGWVGTSLTLRAIVEFWQGKWPQADEHLREGVKLASPFWAGPQHGFLIMFQGFCDETDEVHAGLARLEAALPKPGQANLIGQWNLAILAAEAVGLVGGEEWARGLYPLVLEAMATGTLMRQLDGRLVETAAAMAAAAAGLRDEAERHFESVVARADALPHLMDRPYVRHMYARFLLARGSGGDPEGAERLLLDAVAGYRDIGMSRHEAMAAELLRTARARGGAT